MGNKNFTHRQISTLEEQLMLKAEAYNSPAVLCEKARKAVTELAMGLGSLRERAYLLHQIICMASLAYRGFP